MQALCFNLHSYVAVDGCLYFIFVNPPIFEGKLLFFSCKIGFSSEKNDFSWKAFHETEIIFGVKQIDTRGFALIEIHHKYARQTEVFCVKNMVHYQLLIGNKKNNKNNKKISDF